MSKCRHNCPSVSQFIYLSLWSANSFLYQAAPGIPDSHSTDLGLRLRNMGYIGGSKGATYSDGCEKENAGMVRTRQKKR